MKKSVKILATTLVIISLGGVVYTRAISPKLYDKYLNTGMDYLMYEDYEEAISTLEKAIKIKPKDVEARMYQVKAYAESGQVDNAVRAFEEIRDFGTIDEDLLRNIVEILNKKNPDRAYDVLYRYVQMRGKGNVSDKLCKLFESATSSPSKAKVDTKSGTYVDDISVKLVIDNKKIGHNYYYTTNGTTPNKGSEKYTGEIKITEDTTLNIVGYNKNDEGSEIATFEYKIDKKIVSDLKKNLSKSNKLLKDTKVGTEVGNISKEDKAKLQAVVKKVDDLLKKDNMTYSEVSRLNKKLKKSMKEFKEDIVKPVDKDKLEAVIKKAESLYDNSVEGNNEGNYQYGSRNTLLNVINEGKSIMEDNSSSQADVDSMVKRLNNAIYRFNNSKVIGFTREKALQYAIQKFGQPFEDSAYFADWQTLDYDSACLKYEHKRNSLAMNKYSFQSGLQTAANGKRYYKLHNESNYYLEYHVFVFELIVYEDGTIDYTQIF